MHSLPTCTRRVGFRWVEPTKLKPFDITRLTPAPAQEGFVECACTEPAGTGIGCVCVLRSGRMWTENINHTRQHSGTHTSRETLNDASYARTARFEAAFSPCETSKTLWKQQQQHQQQRDTRRQGRHRRALGLAVQPLNLLYAHSGFGLYFLVPYLEVRHS